MHAETFSFSFFLNIMQTRQLCTIFILDYAVLIKFQKYILLVWHLGTVPYEKDLQASLLNIHSQS